MSRTLSLLAALAALALAACSRTEPPPPKVAPAPRVEAPAAPESLPGSAAEIDPALKQRLARQEAAARMFERNVLEPAPPKSGAPARAPEPPPQRAEPEPPKRAPEPPPKPAEPAPSKPAAPAPRAEAAAPPPPARTDLAAAKPAAVTPAPATRLVTRVDPEFPREAVKAGADKGSVKARITIDEGGGVRRVEILEAYPARVFDRAVVSALSQWRFTEGAAGRTYDTEVEFRR